MSDVSTMTFNEARAALRAAMKPFRGMERIDAVLATAQQAERLADEAQKRLDAMRDEIATLETRRAAFVQEATQAEMNAHARVEAAKAAADAAERDARERAAKAQAWAVETVAGIKAALDVVPPAN